MLKILILTCAVVTVSLSQPLPGRFSDNDAREWNWQNMNGRRQHKVERGSGFTEDISAEVEGFIQSIKNKLQNLTIGMSVNLFKVEDGKDRDEEENRDNIVTISAYFSPSKMLSDYEKRLIDEANEKLESEIKNNLPNREPDYEGRPLTQNAHHAPNVVKPRYPNGVRSMANRQQKFEATSEPVYTRQQSSYDRKNVKHAQEEEDDSFIKNPVLDISHLINSDMINGPTQSTPHVLPNDLKNIRQAQEEENKEPQTPRHLEQPISKPQTPHHQSETEPGTKSLINVNEEKLKELFAAMNDHFLKGLDNFKKNFMHNDAQ